jgi:type IV pilus assembly protein PilW
MNRQMPQAAAGFSIIELMVSVVVGLIILAGVVQVVIGAKDRRLEQEEVAFIQDNARFAVETLSADIRMAGHLVCAGMDSAQVANSINGSFNGFVGLGAVEGYDGSATVSGFPSPINARAKLGTDAFIVRRGDTDSELTVKSHNAASATIDLYGMHKFVPGTPLMIVDANCRYVGLFQVSGPAAASLPAGKIVHNTGSGTNNCTKIIRGKFVCAPSCTAVSCGGFGTTTGAYSSGSKVMGFSARAYFIAESVLYPGMPALMRQTLSGGAPSNTKSEELAQGVEDMEILYGVDTDADGEVNQYRTALQMDVDGSGAITSSDWDKVMSVRLSLVFRSQNPVHRSNQTQTLNGVTYNDRYMRQTVNSTVQIRNRG